MGGNQESLENRVHLSAKLYRTGAIEKVLTLSRDGITEYSPELRRNLTNNEWILRLLESNGISKSHIELIDFKSGFFGTLTEIRGLMKLCSERNWHHIVIISSGYHTARIEATAKGLNLASVTTYKICGSSEQTSFFGSFREFCKLLSYRNIIIPIYCSG